jgi:hypothetical protein
MPISHSLARAFGLPVAALSLLALAACGSKPLPPCPMVRVDNATASVTQFGPGPGRDVNNVAFQAEVLGYKGECNQKEEYVDVTFDLDFALTGGPVSPGGKVQLSYFVAIPQFFPQAEGKRVITVTRDVPPSGKRERFTESSVRVKIPLKKEQAPASFDIYTGFQVNEEQLEYNRANPR